MNTRSTKTHRGRRKIASMVALLIAFVGIAIAANSSGAYFSDTKDGNISGSVGAIRINGSGGTGANGLNFAFNNLMPGEAQSASPTYTNTGNNPEDVWIVFPNATALSALNNLGSYGEVHLSSNGNAVFDSANLKDSSASCGAFSPSGCWPLAGKYKLASNLQPGDTGSMTFAFNYASKLKGQAPAGQSVAFNVYPVPGQTTTNASDGSGDGLPYQLVATQVGQQP
jgi:hypothetical protein